MGIKETEIQRANLEKRLTKIREILGRKKWSFKFFFISVLCSLPICFGVLISDGSIDTYEQENLVWILPFFCLILGPLSSFFFIYYRFGIAQLQEKVIIGELATLGSQELQDQIEEDFFTNLVKINFKYIDKYYLQTQIQADKSFSLSVTCSIIAFIIIAGIVLMAFNKTNSAYVATGSGLLSEFIAAIFFYLYNKTIVKMGEYHHKLVLTQNISLALKITEQMPEKERVVAQSNLIQELTKDINVHIASKV